MTAPTDTRIPIGFAPAPNAVFLLEGEAVAPTGAYSARFTLPATIHPAGCACCAPRGAAAIALAALFHARATGAAPFFSYVAVLASAAGEAAICKALETDITAQTRYRLAR